MTADDSPERHVFDYGDFGPALSLPERLAREARLSLVGFKPEEFSPGYVEVGDSEFEAAVAAAIRAFAAEAAKAARAHKARHVAADTPHYQDGEEIAAAIEALK